MGVILYPSYGGKAEKPRAHPLTTIHVIRTIWSLGIHTACRKVGEVSTLVVTDQTIKHGASRLGQGSRSGKRVLCTRVMEL